MNRWIVKNCEDFIPNIQGEKSRRDILQTEKVETYQKRDIDCHKRVHLVITASTRSCFIKNVRSVWHISHYTLILVPV